MTKLNLRRPAIISIDPDIDDRPPSPSTSTTVIVSKNHNRQRHNLKPSQFSTEGMTKKKKILKDRSWYGMMKYWKIQTEVPKEYMKKWATRLGTNFRSKLVREYVNRGLDACDKFPFIDPDYLEATTTNSFQQANGWECGFMPIKHMRQFVEIIQHDFIHAILSLFQ
ncbi:hypothetical protein M8C21_029306, partial [Ambrosia artemisiifolia]